MAEAKPDGEGNRELDAEVEAEGEAEFEAVADAVNDAEGLLVADESAEPEAEAALGLAESVDVGPAEVGLAAVGLAAVALATGPARRCTTLPESRTPASSG
jgi:hypothetical protein